jgi:aminomuconate-semialdehyde/2-hydroxymuconate-6-semialdehyde dehydrogenase
MLHLHNYINGQLVPPVAGKYLPNYNPATGEVYSQLPDSDSEDVEAAVQAALAAFPNWAATPAEQRGQLLLQLADLIDQNFQRLAEAECTDTGKPLKLAQTMDIPRASSNLRFYGTAIQHFASEAHTMGDTALNYTVRHPHGVVGCISPWNLPLYLFTWKIAPALAAGNCVVAKPSEITPMTAYLLAELCQQAGLPPGVLNIVQGTGPKVGAAITAHPKVPVISFTGGTQTGRTIAMTAAPMFKKLSLELGGKNPNLIFADCDFEQTLETSLRSSFANQGQICLCGSRILVERPLYVKFRDAFVQRVKELPVGDPLAESTSLGAVVSEQHLQKILSYLALARQEGGTILTGGEQVRVEGRCREGWFVAPTVIEGLSGSCRTNTEEIFGPVVTLMPFDTEEEALSLANGTDYGLSATLWTQNLSRAHRVAQQIQSGIVWVNCWLLRDLRTPFGGMKHSGVGREGGFEALRFFTEAQNVCVKL